jgi:hypothetical protein
MREPWGLTWNFLQHLFLWKYRLQMRTMVDLEKIIWRTSKAFVFGNGYNIVLATKPSGPSASVREQGANTATAGLQLDADTEATVPL